MRAWSLGSATKLETIEDPKWKLERADREQFTPPSRYELIGADGAPLTAVLTPEAADEIRRKVLYGDESDDEPETL